MTPKPRILFLYTELAEYFMACCRRLSESAEVHVLRWPVNAEAPFQFTEQPDLKLYSRNDYNTEQLLELAQNINPDLLVCSGWVDRGYLKVARNYRGKIPTVMSMDNHWNASLKQQVARMVFPLTIKRIFSHVWVPGEPQKKYAQKLSFRPDRILTGFYSADIDQMRVTKTQADEKKKGKFPKRFLYLGRYVTQKGLSDLWRAFEAYREEGGTWDLWCAGTGVMWEERSLVEGIRHLGFIQPQQFASIISETSVYILPSHFEPWGVSVQEMAACGMPMILSDQVGSVEQFLEEGKNGFVFPFGSVDQLKEKLWQFDRITFERWQEMSEHSVRLSDKITPDKWARKILSLLQAQ